MELNRLNVKFFVAEPCPLPLTAFIDVFHGWIQAAEGLYYDVADYSHVKAGPGILLVAHEANVSIDETGGLRGLLYSRKQPLQGSNPERLAAVLREAVDAGRRIETEPSLVGKVRFRGEEVLLQVNDRLAAPNTERTFEALRPELEEFFRRLYRGSSCTLERASNSDPRQRFAVLARSERPLSMADLSAHDSLTPALSKNETRR